MKKTAFTLMVISLFTIQTAISSPSEDIEIQIRLDEVVLPRISSPRTQSWSYEIKIWRGVHTDWARNELEDQSMELSYRLWNTVRGGSEETVPLHDRIILNRDHLGDDFHGGTGFRILLVDGSSFFGTYLDYYEEIPFSFFSQFLQPNEARSYRYSGQDGASVRVTFTRLR